MKINKESSLAIITHNFPKSITDRSNAGIFVYDLAEELNKKVKIIVFTAGDEDKTIKIKNIPVWIFSKGDNKKLGDLKLWNPIDYYRLVKFFISGLSNLNKFIANNKNVKFSIAMWAFPGGYFAYKLKERYGIPYAIWALGSDINLYAKIPLLKNMIVKILREADCLFADGIELSKEVERLSGRKCIFLPSTTNVPIKKVIKISIPKLREKIRLVFLGRMELVKGPDIFLDALISNKDTKDKFEIHFIGEGSILKDLKNKAQMHNLSNIIIFHGNIDDKQKINKILKNSDWLIIPSRSDSIPLVFSEAMKSGLPVISSSLPDISFLISKYRVGYTFKSENVNSLERLLASLPEKNQEREIFIKNIKKTADFFNLENITKNLLDILKITN